MKRALVALSFLGLVSIGAFACGAFACGAFACGAAPPSGPSSPLPLAATANGVPVIPPSAWPKPPVLDEAVLHGIATSRGFTYGTPRRATITPDGGTVLFLRSGPDSKKQSLFALDVASGAARELLSPDALEPGAEKLTQEERARRERMRVTAQGFTSFSLSTDGATVILDLSGKVYALDRASGRAHLVPTGHGGAIDPRISPDGKLVAYVQDNDVWVAPLGEDAKPRALTQGGSEDNTHGLADFAAAEELDRARGFFWAPDGKAILYEEADLTGVEHLTIADATHPENRPVRTAYPRAGHANAAIRFGLVALAAPRKTTWIDLDRGTWPYVATVVWSPGAPPTLVALDRLQKNESVLLVDPTTGKTREALREHDDAWIDVDPTVPRWLPDGSGFLWSSDRDGDTRLGVVPVGSKGAPAIRWISPPKMQVTEVLDLDPKARVAVVGATRDGYHGEVLRLPLEGGDPAPVVDAGQGSVRATFSDGVHGALVVRVTTQPGVERTLFQSLDGKVTREIPSVAGQSPPISVTFEDVGPERIHVAIVKPHAYVSGARYPVIDSAYAGPHVQVTSIDARYWALDQWMADATGAIVVRIDAQGTPGRGRAWERALAGRLGDVPLDGHVEVLRAITAAHADMDGAYVGVYGVSFGGYFSALATLKRPDVFKAGAAVAPVVDWRDYDTAYTERYLGLPDANTAAYDAASVLTYARAAPAPGEGARLLIAHGTADDNVYFLHSLKLIDALEKARRPFRFLPFPSQTHMFAATESQESLWANVALMFQGALKRK